MLSRSSQKANLLSFGTQILHEVMGSVLKEDCESTGSTQKCFCVLEITVCEEKLEKFGVSGLERRHRGLSPMAQGLTCSVKVPLQHINITSVWGKPAQKGCVKRDAALPWKGKVSIMEVWLIHVIWGDSAHTTFSGLQDYIGAFSRAR
jgi:hypothetical protein